MNKPKTRTEFPFYFAILLVVFYWGGAIIHGLFIGSFVKGDVAMLIYSVIVAALAYFLVNHKSFKPIEMTRFFVGFLPVYILLHLAGYLLLKNLGS